MGYYTCHTLSIISGNDTDNLIEQFRDENENAQYAFDKNGFTADACKWYDHQKDMRAFSQKHPDVVFLLEGEGEDNTDMWREYYKSGKMQRSAVVITFEQYDENKLS